MLQHDTGRFYKKGIDILLRYILEAHKKRFDEAIIVTDKIPVEKKRKEVEKAIKFTLANWSNPSSTVVWSKKIFFGH
ncbi:MAG: hypothetical protein V1799_15070 [bacterium]